MHSYNPESNSYNAEKHGSAGRSCGRLREALKKQKMKTKTNKKKGIKKIYIIMGIALLILIVGWIFLRFAIGGSEDSWIKDNSGIWIKHGNPAEIPSYVLEQQDTMNCAVGKFDSFTGKVSSQCLGTCGDYAVDLVHVPRNGEDNLAENQCSDYNKGIVQHFIELDNEGNIVRIV
jgi:hypothetical protein